MKPIEEQRTVTVYKCEACRREWGTHDSADTCCGCQECGGPTTEEDRAYKKRHYTHGLLCAWCIVRRAVKAQQGKVQRAIDDVERARKLLAHEEHDLQKEQTALAAFIAKRDALPPKPRQPKKEKAGAA